MNFKQLTLGAEKGSQMGSLLLAGGAATLAATAAIAGTDATFDPANTMVNGWIDGSGGKLITGVAILFAMVNIVTRFNWQVVLGALAVGVTAGIGPDIVGGFVTGTF